MNRNLIYIVAIDSDKSQFKNSDYAQYAILSWEYWCRKNNVDFIVNREHDPRFTFPIWNKEKIFEIGKDYDKIGIVDSDTIVSPFAPNIFNLFAEDEFCGVGDLCDLNWLFSSIEGRQHFFPKTNLDLMKYFNAGVLFFGNKHLKIFEYLLNLYLSRQEEIDGLKGGGKEQTLLNFVVQSSEVDVRLLTPAWNLLSIHRKNMFTGNWQLKVDQTPYFLKYAYIWHFTGFPVEDRTRLMRETWELFGGYL